MFFRRKLSIVSRKSRQGFTLIEILLFTAIFSIVMVAFITVFVAVTRIQGRQSAAAEVNQQSQFLLQLIQRYVESSSLIDSPATDITSTTLRLRMPTLASDPVLIYLSGTTIYLQEGSSGPQPVTSARVSVTALNFTKRSNPPGHDQVSVNFTVQYATSNILQRFTQSLQTSVARVSAASFDSDIHASSSNTYKIGTAAQEWQSINNTIFFGSANNIGIDVASPGQKLEVNGGVLLNKTGGATSTCNSTVRGTLWFGQAGGSATDTLSMCIKDGSDAYLWVRLY